MAQDPQTGTSNAKEPTKDGSAGAKTPADPWTAFFKDLPASETKPLSGATTVKDGAGYPGELVAFSLLNDVTSSIAAAVNRAQANHVLIVEDRALLDSEWPFLSVTTQLAATRDTLDKASELLVVAQQPEQDKAAVEVLAVPPVVSALGALPKIVGGVADIAGMFRTNYAMSSRTMSAEGTPVAAQVASLLLTQSSGVAVSLDGFATVRADASELLTELDEVRNRRRQLEIDSIPVRERVAQVTSVIATLSADRTATQASLLKVLEANKDATQLAERLAAIDEQIGHHQIESAHDVATLAVVHAAVAAHDAFEMATRTAAAGERAPLLSALAREQLHRPNGPSHVLFVSVDSVGADIATPQSQLGETDYVRYFGGMQVSYLLYEVSSGRVVAAEVERRIASAKLDLKGGQLTTTATSELR
jgi:hypothetical protein